MRIASIVLASVLIATLLTFLSPDRHPELDAVWLRLSLRPGYAGATAGLCAALLSVLLLTGASDPTWHILTLRSQGWSGRSFWLSCQCLSLRSKAAA